MKEKLIATFFPIPRECGGVSIIFLKKLASLPLSRIPFSQKYLFGPPKGWIKALDWFVEADELPPWKPLFSLMNIGCLLFSWSAISEAPWKCLLWENEVLGAYHKFYIWR